MKDSPQYMSTDVVRHKPYTLNYIQQYISQRKSNYNQSSYKSAASVKGMHEPLLRAHTRLSCMGGRALLVAGDARHDGRVRLLRQRQHVRVLHLRRADDVVPELSLPVLRIGPRQRAPIRRLWQPVVEEALLAQQRLPLCM